MGVTEARGFVATLEISIWVLAAVLQWACDDLIMMASWHQQLQPTAEQPTPPGRVVPRASCFDTSILLLSRLSSSKVCNVGVQELPSSTTRPGFCQISHLSIHSSQGCSDKAHSAAELGELSLGLLLWWLTGRAVPFSISWARHKERCLSSGKRWPHSVSF